MTNIVFQHKDRGIIGQWSDNDGDFIAHFRTGEMTSDNLKRINEIWGDIYEPIEASGEFVVRAKVVGLPISIPSQN